MQVKRLLFVLFSLSNISLLAMEPSQKKGKNMNKYLLSFLLISGTIVAMDDPTQMAGPALEEYAKKVTANLQNRPVQIQVHEKFGNNTLVAGRIKGLDSRIFVAFFEKNKLITLFGGNGIVTTYIGENPIVREVNIFPGKTFLRVSGSYTYPAGKRYAFQIDYNKKDGSKKDQKFVMPIR